MGFETANFSPAEQQAPAVDYGRSLSNVAVPKASDVLENAVRFGQINAQNQALQQAELTYQRKQQFLQANAELAQGEWDPKKFQRVQAAFPEFANELKTLQESHFAGNENIIKERVAPLYQTLKNGDYDATKRLLAHQRKAAENAGDTKLAASIAKQEEIMESGDPEAIKGFLADTKTTFSVGNPRLFKEVQDQEKAEIEQRKSTAEVVKLEGENRQTLSANALRQATTAISADDIDGSISNLQALKDDPTTPTPAKFGITRALHLIEKNKANPSKAAEMAQQAINRHQYDLSTPEQKVEYDTKLKILSQMDAELKVKQSNADAAWKNAQTAEKAQQFNENTPFEAVNRDTGETKTFTQAEYNKVIAKGGNYLKNTPENNNLVSGVLYAPKALDGVQETLKELANLGFNPYSFKITQTMGEVFGTSNKEALKSSAQAINRMFRQLAPAYGYHGEEEVGKYVERMERNLGIIRDAEGNVDYVTYAKTKPGTIKRVLIGAVTDTVSRLPVEKQKEYQKNLDNTIDNLPNNDGKSAKAALDERVNKALKRSDLTPLQKEALKSIQSGKESKKEADEILNSMGL